MAGIASSSTMFAFALLAIGTLPSRATDAAQDRLMAMNFEGSEQIKASAIVARLRATGVVLRLDRPVDTLTICVVKEVIRDLLAEKGFLDPYVTHRENVVGDGDSANVKITFDIKDGARSRPIRSANAAKLSPFTRCAR